MGCDSPHVSPRSDKKSTNTEACRYEILSYRNHIKNGHGNIPSGNIKLLELGGDLPQLMSDQKWDYGDSDARSKDSAWKDKKRKRKLQPIPVSGMNIERCFDLNNGTAISRTTTIDSVTDLSLAWGVLRTSVPLVACEEDVPMDDCRTTMTIGTNTLSGKHSNLESGDRILIMRKVDNHCSCSCTTDANVEKCDEIHGTYFEICGITRSILTFNDRPCIINHSNTVEDLEPWFLFQSQHMEMLNNNWFLLRVNDDAIDAFKNGKAHFKHVKNYNKKDETRLILSLNDQTHYVERVEMGCNMVLVNPLRMDYQNTEPCNLLLIIGCCKFIHNLNVATPNFAALDTNTDLSLQRILDTLPISDAQIKSFLMNHKTLWPCDWIRMEGDQFKRADPFLLAEFIIKFLRLWGINYKNNCEDRHIESLELRVVWSIVQQNKHEFRFLPDKMTKPSIIFQILRFACDVEETITAFDDYITKLDSEDILNTKLQLNLFKIQRQIAWAICVANEREKMTYEAFIEKIDSLLFSEMIPSYLFDAMIQYLIQKDSSDSGDCENYVKCLRFYYHRDSFGDVALDMARKFNNSRPQTHKINYSLTGKDLFQVGNSDRLPMEENKTPCLDYGIFKLNTMGISTLRFRYSMNSLLAICRSPMSLHISLIAERIVPIEEKESCFITVFPNEKIETLKDVLSSLFKINQRWQLEDAEKKLFAHLGNRQALESITGGPNFHARLWITNKKNKFNYSTIDRGIPDNQLLNTSTSESLDSTLQQITEESYIIINSNVPI
eukprot:XP_001611630.1 hypothetical protein [Babesia bovis T2Bo]